VIAVKNVRDGVRDEEGRLGEEERERVGAGVVDAGGLLTIERGALDGHRRERRDEEDDPDEERRDVQDTDATDDVGERVQRLWPRLGRARREERRGCDAHGAALYDGSRQYEVAMRRYSTAACVARALAVGLTTTRTAAASVVVAVAASSDATLSFSARRLEPK